MFKSRMTIIAICFLSAVQAYGWEQATPNSLKRCFMDLIAATSLGDEPARINSLSRQMFNVINQGVMIAELESDVARELAHKLEKYARWKQTNIELCEQKGRQSIRYLQATCNAQRLTKAKKSAALANAQKAFDSIKYYDDTAEPSFAQELEEAQQLPTID